MFCSHFEAGRCGSCTLIRTPYERQVADKESHLRALLADFELTWLAAVTSPQSGFRNKAKMVVTGTAQAPVLGILDHAGNGVDLHDCPLYAEPLQRVLQDLAGFITAANIAPYDLATRRGELKYVLVTQSPADQFMVRFVLRSQEPVTRIKKHLPVFLAEYPHVTAVSANIQPEHKAVLEGDLEIPLTKQETLPMVLGDVTLHLRPQSFFQTNTAVGAQMYAQAQDWIAYCKPGLVWDLFCGVGGFALHAAPVAERVVGVEISAQAIESAKVSAAELGFPNVQFYAGDATATPAGESERPDLIVVNPPRRGIGARLATWLEESKVQTVIYSSCNARTLAKDLAAMPSLKPVSGRLLDMFPNTDHYEVMVLLKRAG